MMVMPSDCSNGICHYLAGRYPGKIGWLFCSMFREPREWMPYAIDNGAYGAWEAKRPWDEAAFLKLLDRCRLSPFKPMWVAVPDVVGDKKETLWRWNQYELGLRKYGWPLAFVVQDGMTAKDVPKSADVVFVGGTTTWKWRNVAMFCDTFPRVHVGRVNWFDKLEFCERVGAESCDGSGYFRQGETGKRARHLIDFVSGIRRYKDQMEFAA